MLYVFARDLKEVNYFAKRNKLQPKQFRYVSSAHTIAGIGAENTWVALTGFWQRKDYNELAVSIRIIKASHGFDNVDKEYKVL